MLVPVTMLALVLAANPYLEDGRQLFKALRYPEAARQLELAVRAPGSSKQELLEAYDLYARALAAEGRVVEAERAYLELVRIDPESPGPQDASPRLRDLFRQAKSSLYPEGFVHLEELPSPGGTLEIKALDPWRSVASVILRERSGPGRFESRRMLRAGGRWSASRSGRPFFVEALDAGGTVLARIGSADEPRAARDPGLPLGDARAGSGALPLDAVSSPAAEVASAETRCGAGCWVLGALAVGAGAAAAGMAIVARRDYSAAGRAGWADETRALDQRAKLKETAAWVLLGAAGVSAGATVLVWSLP